MDSASPIPGDRRVYRCTIMAGDTRPRPHPDARYGRDGATIIEPGQRGYLAACRRDARASDPTAIEWVRNHPRNTRRRRFPTS
jgi:hypothetical protein